MTLFQRIINWLSMTFAVSLVLSSLAFAYVLLAPIDVVTDWELRVEDQTYHPGDDIIVHASYKKLKDVNGTAYYYLECETDRDTLVRYPINQTEGNRPKGTGQTDILLQIPSALPSPTARCRIAVSVGYNIYTFRKFVENNESNYFNVAE